MALESVALDVLDSLLEGCQVIGFDWRYLYVNPIVAAQGQRSRDELIGRTMMECYPGIEATPMFATLQHCMAARQHERIENEFTFPDGSKGHFELRFVPVPEGVCILSLDVTDNKRSAAALARSEEQLRQSQKMEAIGRLAGGVAHDFNNLLSVVLSYSALILSDAAPDDPMRPDVVEIQKAGERAAELTRQLLAFSRQQVLEPRILDLNGVVDKLGKMIHRLVGADIDLRIAPGEALGRVKADPGHIEQVLMNLIVNARDAMPGGGRLTIETENVLLDASYAAEHLGANPGRHVMLAVSDTGIGMDKETQARIFEPFFTTKDKSKGTGLGLSTVFGIVRQSGGTIWVYSEPGKGSTFKIYLPRTDEAQIPVTQPVPAITLYGTETVLLVEDEEQLRVVTRGILRRVGYQVIEARDGSEALAVCESHPGPIHLLLTDVVMPNMGGRELASRMLETRPELHILYMSGYAEEAIVHSRVLEAGNALLQKPITPELVLRRVREVLDTPR